MQEVAALTHTVVDGGVGIRVMESAIFRRMYYINNYTIDSNGCKYTAQHTEMLLPTVQQFNIHLWQPVALDMQDPLQTVIVSSTIKSRIILTN